MRTAQFLMIISLFGVCSTGYQATANASSADGVNKVSITRIGQYGDLFGRWKSKVDSRWGGRLNIHIDSNKGASTFKGKLIFSNSGCPWKAPFDGTISDSSEIELKANPGGKCGKVTIKGTFKDGKLMGTYDAEYPDSGTVQLK